MSDLSASPLSSTSIQLSWTAVGDDGNTPATAASSYDIRLSTAPISNDADFTAATPIAVGVPDPPQTQGSGESFTVSGLDPDTLYYFAMKVADDVDNISSLSNVASATTDDSVAPADITNLSASIGQASIGLSSATAISSSGDKDASHSKEAVVDGNLSTFWISTPRATMQTSKSPWTSVARRM